MDSETQSSSNTSINTKGGSFIEGNVITRGDFVGKNKYTIVTLLTGERLFETAAEIVTEYMLITVWTLRKPILRFPVVISKTQNSVSEYPEARTQKQGNTRINGKLLGFVLFGFVVGITLNTLIPGVKPNVAFFPTIIFMSVYWLFTVCLLHGLCKIMRGQGRFVDTLSIGLQVASVLYIFCGFITLVFVAILSIYNFAHLLFASQESYLFQGQDSITVVYFLLHFIFASIYFPLALKYVHNFNVTRAIMLFSLSFIGRLLLLILSSSFYISLSQVDYTSAAYACVSAVGGC